MKYADYYTALSPDGKRALARRLKTSVAYLSQLATGHRKAGLKYLLLISRATDGAVTPIELRPDCGALTDFNVPDVDDAAA